jgi:hypothetical protein
MKFGEKLVVYIFRPIYRTFFERLLWWFLTRIKAFFFAETSVQLSQILRKLEIIEASQQQQQQRWAEIEARLRATEGSNAAQWDGLEQLLLALLRQPDYACLSKDSDRDDSQKISPSNTAGLSRVQIAANSQ